MSPLFKIPEPVSRASQADKIKMVLKEHLKANLEGKRILEIGCGSGEISFHLSNCSASVWGVEIDPLALKKEQISASRSLALSVSDGRHLPFADDSIDIIILPQVYEHIQDQKMLSSEMFRVLKPDGICFFSGPNRWRLIEPHYFLPFLSWLPHVLADKYLKLTKRGTVFDIYPRSYWGLMRLWQQFKIVDYTWKMIKYPEKFNISERLRHARLLKQMPACVIQAMKPFYSNYNWVLVKEKNA